MTKVAVVTGSNKGIGFAIVRGLCKKFDGDVFLTARSEERGAAAVAELQKEGLAPKFHALDVTDHGSVTRLRDFLLAQYGGLDVLVNNAGIAFKEDSTAPIAEQAEVSSATNFTALLDCCDVLFPILRSGARVAHLASFTAPMCLQKASKEVKVEVTSAKSVEDVVKFMNNFVSAVKDGSHEKKGYPSWTYAMSKVGVVALTAPQQKKIDSDKSRNDILINSCDPGYVNTDMTTGKGMLTPDQARSEERGAAAVAELQKEGLAPKFHALDVTDHGSVTRLRDFLLAQYGGLDVLVNNAGIAYKQASTAPFAEQAEVTVKTNFTATLDVCDVLFPILRPGARVSHVSSMVSIFALKKCSKEIQQAATSPNSIADVVKLIETFVSAAKAGDHEAKGFANSSYGMSKLGLTAVTALQQKAFDSDERKDIVVNACCPGYVDTDMSSHKGHLTIDQGAENPLYLALLPPGVESPRGKFIQELKITPWVPQN